MTFMSRLFARREFTLPPFDLKPLEFELRSAAEPDELLLDRVVATSGGGANVVSLSKPLPTPGELRETIESHLNAARTADAAQAPDPADELRNALAELRRSLA